MQPLTPYYSFLSTPFTDPCHDRDYVEWHGGIERYGFWAIVVQDATWIRAYKAGREHLLPFMYPGYQRAPHITIACCGLLHPSYFPEALVRRQIEMVQQAKISPFLLHLSEADSFASVPYLRVRDPSDSLSCIREHLKKIAKEDNPGSYTPHVTLGQYCDIFETRMIASHLQTVPALPTEPLRVSAIEFCSYQTDTIQGPFTVLERVALWE